MKKIEDSIKKKEQIMSKEKIKRAEEKVAFDKKHAEELEAAKNEANQKLMMGAAVATFLSFVMAYLVMGGSSSAAASAGADL